MSNIDLIMEENRYTGAENLGKDESLQSELAGFAVRFNRIKFPSGAGINFELTGENGEIRAVSELEGVILLHHPLNSLYKNKYTGVNNPPDCISIDGISGTGIPGGNCETCFYNQFGTDSLGTGKACKNKRRIYLLLKGEVYPVMVELPSASVKEFNLYINRLLGKAKRSSSLVTRISLRKAVSSSGVWYSQAVFTAVRDLNQEEMEAIYPAIQYVKEASNKMTIGTQGNFEREFEDEGN